ncbi:MAG: GYD domain-containing protein, partial [Candidatus Desulfofervidus sp.]|nr:GYD domain-containing protein [Candidatus Desulfofervidus sp.]
MATFFMFGKYSSEALKGISAERTEKAMEIFKKLGGEVKSMYALVGNYDLVFIVELPGIEQAIQASVALSEMSGISLTTAPAITV